MYQLLTGIWFENITYFSLLCKHLEHIYPNLDGTALTHLCYMIDKWYGPLPQAAALQHITVLDTVDNSNTMGSVYPDISEHSKATVKR